MKPDPKFNGRYIDGAKGIKLFVEEVGDPSNPSILWIHGQNDVHFPPRFATYIANHVPHAKRNDYANCGHMPFFEMAERFNQDVADFVNAVKRPSAFAS